MRDLDERELVSRCKDGNEAAFKELVDRYKDLVFALAARTVGDRSRAEDLAQEVFLRVHRGLPYFRGEAKLSTWIYRIATNLCLQRADRREVPLEEGEPARLRPELAVADRAFSDLELKDRLEKAIARLPANYRLLVAAHYLKEMRYEELAEALQMPLGTIKTQLHRAKRRLREVLERQLS